MCYTILLSLEGRQLVLSLVDRWTGLLDIFSVEIPISALFVFFCSRKESGTKGEGVVCCRWEEIKALRLESEFFLSFGKERPPLQEDADLLRFPMNEEKQVVRFPAD